jgi:hypothetical protein
VAWGVNNLCPRSRDILANGSGLALRWAYEKLRWKIEHRFGEKAPADLRPYVRVLRRPLG